MKRMALAVAPALLASSAWAQSTFVTPSGAYADGAVPLCYNGTYWVPCSINNLSMPVAAGPYPSSAVPITASATGTISSITATLTGVASKTTYICGFSITSGATIGLGGTATVTGTVTGTMSYVQPVSALPGIGQLNQTFSPCIPASAVNTGISVNSAAAGIGGNAAVSTWGYQL
jgi:hypothetical protein